MSKLINFSEGEKHLVFYDVFYIDQGQTLLCEFDVSIERLSDVVLKAVSVGHHGLVIYPSFKN